MADDRDDPSALLSIRELARRWKRSTRTLQRWRAAGYGAAYIVIGGSVYYRKADVLAFEAQHRRAPGDTE